MNKVSFVYFDIGGVVISDLTANHKWNQLKHDLGIINEQDTEFESFFDAFEKEVNVGNHTIDEILPLLKTKFGIIIRDN